METEVLKVNWDEMIEEECRKRFGLVTFNLHELSTKNRRRGKRINDGILQLFVVNTLETNPQEFIGKDIRKEMIRNIKSEALTDLSVHQQELATASSYILRKNRHLEFPQMLTERAVDTIPQMAVWLSDLSMLFNATSGEDRISYDVLTGRQLSSTCKELMPYFLHTASYIFAGRELKRIGKLGIYWPQIAFLLVDSQSGHSVIPPALSRESIGGTVNVAKYLLQSTPYEGYRRVSVNPPPEELYQSAENRLQSFSKEKGGACEIPDLMKKIDRGIFSGYVASLIFNSIRGRTNRQAVETFIDSLIEKAGIDSSFMPDLSYIKQTVRTEISLYS